MQETFSNITISQWLCMWFWTMKNIFNIEFQSEYIKNNCKTEAQQYLSKLEEQEDQYRQMRIDKSELEIELKDRQRKIDSHQKTMRNVEEEYRKLSELF